MKKFADVYLNIPDKEKMVKFVRELNFQTVAVCISESSQPKDLDKLGEQYGVKIVRRVNLKPSTVPELMRELNKWRLNSELIGVECVSATIARQAAKDHRVDLLSFPVQSLRFFDNAEAELASKANAALEVIFNSIVRLESRAIPKAIGMLRRNIATARKYGIPIVGSSGASNLLEMRAARDMAAFFQLLGLSVEESLNAFSRNPLAIIERNQIKLSGEYVGVGVRIIKKGGGRKDG